MSKDRGINSPIKSLVSKPPDLSKDMIPKNRKKVNNLSKLVLG